MTFPIWYILVPWSATVLFSAIFLFFNLVHLKRYGVDDKKTRSLMWGYAMGFLIILVASSAILLPYNWLFEVSPSDIFDLDSDLVEPFGL